MAKKRLFTALLFCLAFLSLCAQNSMIGMNWGWGMWYNDDSEWFALTGDWIKDNDNWNIDRYMIYNFSVIVQ